VADDRLSNKFRLALDFFSHPGGRSAFGASPITEDSAIQFAVIRWENEAACMTIKTRRAKFHERARQPAASRIG
jgi:hypothetical protein